MERRDQMYMERALSLAQKAEGRTDPNPMVGAVLVRSGRIVAQGWHRRAGTPHAEAVALRRAGDRARGGTLYVTLEPCCHKDKRTPPCADAIIRGGISRVVAAMTDPNPRVRGRGIRRLRAAGIAVETGLLGAEARRQNRVFVHYMKTGTPWVTLKAAQSLDGRIATRGGESKWITSAAARRHGHRLRGRNQAILVGVQTVLADDPRLTARFPGGRDPVRIVLDSRLRTPPESRLFEAADSPVWIATTASPRHSRYEALRSRGAEMLRMPADDRERVDLRALVEELGRREIASLLIEGGGEVHGAALAAGIVRRVLFFVAPRIIGGTGARPSVGGTGPARLADAVRLGPMAVTPVGADLLIDAEVRV